MRVIVILVLVAGIFGCNSEATVCPQPGLCDNGPQDAALDADATADAAVDAAIEAPSAEADAE